MNARRRDVKEWVVSLVPSPFRGAWCGGEQPSPEPLEKGLGVENRGVLKI